MCGANNYTKKQPSLLFLDTFTAHLTDQVLQAFKEANTTVRLIPGGCTPVLQPLHVSINKPIKTVLRQSWNQYMLSQSDTGVDKKKPPSKQLVLN